ncbi:MAG: hypothetical protein K2L11_08465 [Muribaculaceae bacterium]|nr:hypothetical protein [Muribaculaceae bacterium]
MAVTIDEEMGRKIQSLKAEQLLALLWAPPMAESSRESDADIKRLGNAKVYNKPVWDRMYDHTLQDIKYGYREWLRQTYGDSLRQN